MKPNDPDNDFSTPFQDEPTPPHNPPSANFEKEPNFTPPSFFPPPLSNANTKLGVFNEGANMLFWAYLIMAAALVMPYLGIGSFAGFVLILVAQNKMGKMDSDMKTAFRIQLFSFIGYVLLMIAVLVQFMFQLFATVSANITPTIDSVNRPLWMINILSILYSTARIAVLFFQSRPLDRMASSNVQGNVLSRFKIPFLLLAVSTLFSVVLNIIMSSQIKTLLTTMAKTNFEGFTPDRYLTYFSSSPTVTPLARVSSFLLLASYILYVIALYYLRNHLRQQVEV